MLFDGVAGKFRNAAVFRLDRQRAAALIYGAALCRIVGDGIGVFRLIVEKGSVDDFVDDAAGAVAGIVVYCTALGAYGFGNIAGKRTVFYLLLSDSEFIPSYIVLVYNFHWQK